MTSWFKAAGWAFVSDKYTIYTQKIIPKKTHLCLEENAFTFYLKRKCVLHQTLRRFSSNALAFEVY